MWRRSYKFVKRFEEIVKEYRGIDCRDIAQVDWADKEASREFHTNPEGNIKVCERVVGEAAYALGELLAQDTK